MGWFVGNEDDPNNPNNGLPIVERVLNHEYDYDIDDVRDDDIGTGLVAQFHMALNAKGPERELTSDDVKIVRLNDLNYQMGDLCCFFFHDVTGYVDLLDDLTSCFSLQCFGLQLPDFDCLHSVHSIEELIVAYVEAIQIIQPEAPYILLGFGMGCQLAYEAAVQMGPERVASVVFIDGQVTKERGFHQDAIWYGLYTLIAQEISVDRFVKEMQRRRRFEDQLQYMLHFVQKTWIQVLGIRASTSSFAKLISALWPGRCTTLTSTTMAQPSCFLLCGVQIRIAR